MGSILKYLVYTVVLILGLILLAVFVFVFQTWWEYRLPSQQYARQRFEEYKVYFLQFAKLLRDDPSVTYVGNNDGKVGGMGGPLMPKTRSQYLALMRKIGAKFVIVREDGSMEFALWGNGGAIMSDSYMGVRYFPNDHKTNSAVGYTQALVASLDGKKLPQENGDVATGLYVVPIEPEWFLYRFEYQE